MTSKEESITISQAMTYLQLKRCWVHRAMTQGKLVAHKVADPNRKGQEVWVTTRKDCDNFKVQSMERKQGKGTQFVGNASDMKGLAEWAKQAKAEDVAKLKASLEALQVK